MRSPKTCAGMARSKGSTAGKASADQLEFLLSKHERGALVMVAWSAQDVASAFGKFLEINRRALK